MVGHPSMGTYSMDHGLVTLCLPIWLRGSLCQPSETLWKWLRAGAKPLLYWILPSPWTPGSLVAYIPYHKHWPMEDLPQQLLMEAGVLSSLVLSFNSREKSDHWGILGNIAVASLAKYSSHSGHLFHMMYNSVPRIVKHMRALPSIPSHFGIKDEGNNHWVVPEALWTSGESSLLGDFIYWSHTSLV